MRKMKKLLAAVLTVAMVMSMIVLPVSAEETREQFRLADDKQFVLEAGAQAYYYLSSLLDGYAILYDTNNASYSISISDADGNSVKLYDWNEGLFVGYGFKVEEGKTYNIDISNNTDETVNYDVYMWLAECYGDLNMSQTAYAGNAQTTVNLTVSSETAMAFEPITWTSSDPDVAEIGTGSNMNRVIDLLAPGTATITATTASGLTATCEVTVKDQQTIAPGETKNFTLEKDQQEVFLFTPAESGRYIAYYPVSSCFVDIYEGTQLDASEQLYPDMWQDSAFKYQGHAFDAEAGKTYLIRAVNNWSDAAIDCQLSVMKAENYELFEIDWDETGLVGEERTVSVNFAPENASEAVTWASSDESVVRITNPKGTEADIKLLGPGTATVTATSASGKVATCTVTVEQELTVRLDETVNVELGQGESVYYDFTPAEDGRYIFVMDTDKILDITVFYEDSGWRGGDFWTNSDGTKEGYSFELTAGNKYTVAVLNSSDALLTANFTLVKAGNFASISFPKSDYSGYEGGFLTLRLNGTPEYATESITWTTSNSDIVYIEYADGVEADLILMDTGTATITAATASGLTATCTITVKEMIELHKNEPIPVPLNAGETAVCYFEAPTSGTYSVYAAGDYFDGVFAVFDGVTGELLTGEYWYQNGTEGYDYELSADSVYLIYVINMEDADTYYSVCIGQRGKADVMYFQEGSAQTYRGMRLTLEPCFAPTLSYRENVSWTSSDSGVVKFSHKYEEGPYVSYYFNVLGAGTATLTATSENGLKATFTVNALEPEDLTSGDYRTPTLDSWSYVVYNIIPEQSGTHYLRWENSEYTHVQLWHSAQELESNNYMDGDLEVLEAELTAGEEYFLLIQNLADEQRIFAFELENPIHIHKLTAVAEKAATYTETGLKAHYACACGARFSDEAGTTEITLEELRIPMKERPEGVLVGDVNGDGEVGISDLMRLANHFAKGVEINEANADCNGDGMVTISDLMRLANYFAGKAQLG